MSEQSLQARLTEDMKTAMREKEAGRAKLSVIRMVRAAIKNAEIEKRTTLDDAAVLEIIGREIKQRRETIEGGLKAGREEMVKQAEAEIEILQAYLPEQLSEAEVEAEVRKAIEATGAEGPSDLGRVMSAVMPKLKGRAEGRIINETAARLLRHG